MIERAANNGAGTLTALALRCEVGDFRRFPNTRSFLAFLGLVPSEHSSGNTIRCGSITKTGNSYLRRLLVESSWKFVSREKNSGALRKKPEGQNPPMNSIEALLDRKVIRLSLSNNKNAGLSFSIYQQVANDYGGSSSSSDVPVGTRDSS
jgi:transposase